MLGRQQRCSNRSRTKDEATGPDALRPGARSALDMRRVAILRTSLMRARRRGAAPPQRLRSLTQPRLAQARFARGRFDKNSRGRTKK